MARVDPVLRALGSAVHTVAGPVGSAAVLKLAVNALLTVQVAALGELVGFIARHGLEPARALGILTDLPVASPALRTAAASVQVEDWTPRFPIELATKDLDYVVGAATAIGAAMPLAGSARTVFADALRAGYGAQHMTAVAKLYR